MEPGIPNIDVLGVPVVSLAPDEALVEIEKLFDRDAPAIVAHVNAHTLNLAYEDDDYRSVLRRADLVLNDGKGIMLAARILGQRFPADLNGNFFTPLVLKLAAARGWRAFFLGAGPGIADRVGRIMRARLPGLTIVGTRDGYFGSDDEAIASIREAGAEILLVGMGNPLQELWLDRCLADTGTRMGVGVGAFFDFIAGTVPRAPSWMNRMGIEWVHRLAQEPTRMWRRYLLGNPKFIGRNLRRRFSGTVQ